MSLRNPSIELRLFGWFCAAVTVFSWTAGVNAAETSQRPPNILWIITDDQRPDSLACYNRAVTGKAESPLGYVESPNWDRLAAEGVLFTRAFCNSPGCAPSRASMHTGQYPHHNGIYGFDRAHNRADICPPTVPQILREEGYLTARFGKLGVRINEWGPGLTWNDPGHYTVNVDMDRDLARKGITDFLKQNLWKKGGVVDTKEHWYFSDGSHVEYYVERTDGPLTEEDLKARREIEQRLNILRAYTRQLSLLIIGGESPQGSDGTLDARIEQAFESFLDGNDNSGDKPLFIHLGFHFPHTPVLVPKEWRDRFADKTYRVPEFSKEELERLPPQLVTLYEKMKIDELKPEEKQQAIRDYYAFCAYGDWLLGKAVDRFKEYCRARNEDYLIVIACGDHGWHLGENGYEAKFGPYRMSNQCAVVAISSRGEFPAGTVCDRYVEYVDFAPTFFQAAGMDVHSDAYAYLDGFPLQEIVSGTAVEREYVLGESTHVYGPRAYLRNDMFAFSMRTRPNRRLKPGEDVRWALDAPLEDVEPALFDLRVDPAERWNVADDPRYRPLVEFLREKLGLIVLGDGRVECDWEQENVYAISDFAPGADDKKLAIPPELIPPVK